jgi:hypothetical protein
MPDIAKTMVEGFDELARHLRQEAGADLRGEAAEEEQLTELQRRRRQSMTEAIRMAMHRGDHITAHAGGLTLGYPVVTVGEDYLTMRDEERWIDLRVPEATIVIEARPAGGTSGRPAAATFRARMGEHEQEQSRVEIVGREGARWEGRMEIVGPDHLVLSAHGGQTLLPLRSVVVVFSRFPPRRA